MITDGQDDGDEDDGVIIKDLMDRGTPEKAPSGATLCDNDNNDEEGGGRNLFRIERKKKMSEEVIC